MPKINPQILTWARETAGLSLEEAAKKLGFAPTLKTKPADRLQMLEQGKVEPSRSTLVKMAQQYRRPLVTFYMEQRPSDAARVEDFRNVPDRDASTDALIATVVRDVRARQGAVKELLLEDEAKTLDYVASQTRAAGVDVVASSMQQTLLIETKAFRAQKTPEHAFAFLRRQAEQAGVFVLLIGNLGSHHTTIDADAFRGFALADKIAPFVVINDQDAHTAWSFTLLHELAHIWIGASGISGGKISEDAIETFCNQVASTILLPAWEIGTLNVSLKTAQAEVITQISTFAKARHLSSSMVAYAALRAGKIDNAMYRTITAFFREQWRKNREAQKLRQKEVEGGPSFYTVRRHRLGQALLQVVSRALDDGSLTPTRAGQVLGVKPRNVAPLLNTERVDGRAA